MSLSRVGNDGTWPSDTGPIHGVVVGADSKALVWTKEPEFTDLGYDAPTDWASFMALADTMVADGRTPFCLELESGGADGWPATDWVEMVVLRTGGPDFYDAWIAPRGAVRRSGRRRRHPHRRRDGAPAGIPRRQPRRDAALRDFGGRAAAPSPSSQGRCLMTPFPSFLPGVIGPDADLPVGTFPFPTFGPATTTPSSGAAAFAVAVTDRPEVRR